MVENTGLMMLVVAKDHTRTSDTLRSVRVNIYRENAVRAVLHEIDMPRLAFPHEPEIGEQFTLVVA